MFNKYKQNIKGMIGSVMIAFILWFYVITNEIYYNHRTKIPLYVKEIAPGKTLLNKVPDEVLVEFQGKGISFIIMWFYDTSFELMLPDVRTSQRIDLNKYYSSINIPPAVQLKVVQIISPTEINLELDDYCEEYKPLAFVGNIIPAKGYEIIEQKFEQDSALVSGPKSLVCKIQAIFTDSLIVNEVKSDFTKTARLQSPNLDLVKVKPTTVKIAFDIQRLGKHFAS